MKMQWLQRGAACSMAAGALLFTAGYAHAQGAATGPSPASALPFDLSGPLESQLAAIGCSGKTQVDADDPWHVIALCPAGAANDAIVDQLRNVAPHDIHTVSAGNQQQVGMVVDEWDPSTCPSCRLRLTQPHPDPTQPCNACHTEPRAPTPR
ncbi:MAG: hypothetical protein QM820_63495 [Minicystis sp.]